MNVNVKQLGPQLHRSTVARSARFKRYYRIGHRFAFARQFGVPSESERSMHCENKKMHFGDAVTNGVENGISSFRFLLLNALQRAIYMQTKWATRYAIILCIFREKRNSNTFVLRAMICNRNEIALAWPVRTAKESIFGRKLMQRPDACAQHSSLYQNKGSNRMLHQCHDCMSCRTLEFSFISPGIVFGMIPTDCLRRENSIFAGARTKPNLLIAQEMKMQSSLRPTTCLCCTPDPKCFIFPYRRRYDFLHSTSLSNLMGTDRTQEQKSI